jgi:TetR/AcrR family transcriptional repressor of nem operon
MRYKEYNVNKVLEKSIALFWQKGFNGCSINEIVRETGVNRFSLYKEFENKEGILYASFKLYRERYCEDKLSLLKSDGDLFEVIKDFYMAFLDDDEPVSGCYFIHIGTELADSDPRVKQGLGEYLKEIQALLTDLLVRRGYSPSEAELKARHLLGWYCTVMSFCLIHTNEVRKKYVTNGVHLILSNHAQSTS